MIRSAAERRLQAEFRPTRERLIRAAVFHFQVFGYHGTGLSAVLQRANATKGSLYHHFPGGKEELAVAAMQWIEHEVTRFLDDLAPGRVRMMVEGLARYTAEGIRRSENARGSLAAVLAQDAMPGSAAIARALRHYVSAVRSRLAKAYAAESDVQSPIEFADGALAVIQGAAALARIEKKPERAAEIVEIWLDGWTPLIPSKQRR